MDLYLSWLDSLCFLFLSSFGSSFSEALLFSLLLLLSFSSCLCRSFSFSLSFSFSFSLCALLRRPVARKQIKERTHCLILLCFILPTWIKEKSWNNSSAFDHLFRRLGEKSMQLRKDTHWCLCCICRILFVRPVSRRVGWVSQSCPRRRASQPLERCLHRRLQSAASGKVRAVGVKEKHNCLRVAVTWNAELHLAIEIFVCSRLHQHTTSRTHH